MKLSWGGDCSQDLQTQSVVRADAGFPLFIKDRGVATCCSAVKGVFKLFGFVLLGCRDG